MSLEVVVPGMALKAEAINLAHDCRATNGCLQYSESWTLNGNADKNRTGGSPTDVLWSKRRVTAPYNCRFFVHPIVLKLSMKPAELLSNT